MKLTTMSSRRLASTVAISLLFGFALGLGCSSAAGVVGPDVAGRDGEQPATNPIAQQRVGDPGITADHVLFGQSAAFSGPAAELGNDMRMGIQAAFNEANAVGGVYGRELKLESLNDSYESDFAASNTHTLIEKEKVFALIGAVGTPTSRAAAPVAQAGGVPFIAPFTGAEFLRDPELHTVMNVRASYFQETEEMVARLTEDLGVTDVAVFYQDDSYGKNGLDGATMALGRRGLEPAVSWSYPRNTIAVKSATLRIAEADPEAVIMIGAYAPVARAIELMRRDIDPIFMTVSFVGSNALAEALGETHEGVYVTQVVPLPGDDTIPVVARYHAALSEYDANAEPGFVSLEGYLAGRLAIAGLSACGPDLSRECFLDSLRDAGTIDIDGMHLKYGPDDNQGSDAVFLTTIRADGTYEQVDTLQDKN